jgi:ubiquinone/menaquinone biosynthesis C-methylase UbiE
MEPQVWWNQNAEKSYDRFKEWVGDDDASSKVYSAKYCNNKNYKTVADLGCGDATFFYSLKNVNANIQYLGVDSCTFFVKLNTSRQIPMLESDIRRINSLADSSIDWAYSRHTLEHQPNFKLLLEEMIRVGKLEACHIFFIKPHSNKTITNHDGTLYHNTYSIQEIESFLSSNPKVSSWKWVELNKDENALHIFLQESKAFNFQTLSAYTSS